MLSQIIYEKENSTTLWLQKSKKRREKLQRTVTLVLVPSGGGRGRTQLNVQSSSFELA